MKIKHNYWLKYNIEKPIQEIVKNLRCNGINTFCSCGHGMWAQCETYDSSEELNAIFNVLVEMGIKEYKVEIIFNYEKGYGCHRCLEISFPDKNGEYYRMNVDNDKYVQNIF